MSVIYRCKMCGGDLEAPGNEKVAMCPYCGAAQTLPNTNDEVIANLYNRANNLRLKCEFDKAEKMYDKIVQLDDSQSEAHWGIVLCKYGIEYIEDPKTFNRVPTCHRTLYDAVMSDIDYISAIENADISQKALYEAEAKQIDKIQKNILSVVKEEKPFDVFICYKETDESGKRTIDSTIANDIYYQLTQEGFKVFYAAVTLEDKLGEEYEPYIFAALNSAKVMLVLGTNPEYFTSVWVKNEWSRYLKLMKENRDRLLIPCYRDMDAYELPEEFAHLQAQDMSKLGFMQDLIRGIKKIVQTDKGENLESSQVDRTLSDQVSVERLLKNGETYLKLNNYSEAENIYKKATKDFPENYKGWWGLIVCSTCNFSQVSKEQDKVDVWYEYVRRLATESTIKDLKAQYVDYLKLVAKVDAQTELSKIERTKQSLSKKLTDFQEQINMLENEHKSMESRHQNLLKAQNERVAQCKLELAKSEIAYEKYKVKAGFYAIGGVVTSIFVISAIIGGIVDPGKVGGIINFLTWLVVIALGFIPIYLFFGAATLGDYKRDIPKKQNDLCVAQNEISKLEQDYSKSLELHQMKIDQQKQDIVELDQKIHICDDYIRDKADALLRHFHSLRCKKIDIDIPFSEDIVFPLANVNDSDTVKHN